MVARVGEFGAWCGLQWVEGRNKGSGSYGEREKEGKEKGVVLKKHKRWLELGMTKQDAGCNIAPFVSICMVVVINR